MKTSLVSLLLLGSACNAAAFVPAAQKQTRSLRTASRLHSTSSKTRTVSWIEQGLNAEAQRDPCVVGPKQVVVYDTSLRGTE